MVHESISVEEKSRRRFKRNAALIVIVAVLFFSLPNLCDSHGDHDHHHHDHDHHDPNPSFKYSRQANEDFKPPVKKQHNHDHDHHHDHAHDHHHHHSEAKKTSEPLDMKTVWIHSMSSTLLISAAPYVLLYIIPLDNTEAMRPRLKVLLAFASGGLLGDAFLHLIPHATHPHSHHGDDHGHDHHHDHGHGDEHSHGHDMSVGLYVLAGIIAFLSVEKLVRLLKGGEGGHGHSHSHAPKKVDDKKKEKSDDKKKSKDKKTEKEEKKDEVAITGYLNLAADFAHNFTDGLAIGASYLAGNSIGIVTTVTILLHEVPHEIGDFAILIKSGCSRRKAMLLQLITAVGALAGTAIALYGVGEAGNGVAPWVLPFTAGGFIYIATVSVLPELLEESTKLWQSLKEISALLVGVGLMVVIANYE